jgi:hypothetical protein
MSGLKIFSYEKKIKELLEKENAEKWNNREIHWSLGP